MKYRMIALDLDGTLLDGGGVASASNLDAIARARAAGALVVPCTGRGWRESCGALRELTNGLAIPVPAGQKPEIAGAPGVFACGSSVNDLGTGKALHTMGIAADLALELVRFLADMPDSVLVFGDLERAGYNYLVTGSGVLSPNTQWWFEATEVTVRYQKMVELTDLGRDTMSQIRSILFRMREQETDLLVVEQEQAEARFLFDQTALFVLIGVAAISLIFIIAVLLRLEHLRQIVTICSWTGQVKYDGEWIRMEDYLQKRFGLAVSHGLSKEAAEKMTEELRQAHASRSTK